MKQILKYTFLLVLLTQQVKAQYSIVAYPPPSAFTHADLWHLTVMAPADSAIGEYYIALRVRDDQSQLLLKSNSSEFPRFFPSLYVNAGSLGSISPILSSYTSSQLYMDLITIGGIFPAGNYNVSFTLYGRPSDGEYYPLAEFEYPIAAELLFPFYLITVPDGDSICETNPLFTWTPAFGTTSLVSYHFKLVELQPFQSPQSAMSSNPYHYNEQAWPVTLLSYPATAAPLVQGNQYAWQVDAMVDGQVLTASELWTFTYGCAETDTVDSLQAPTLYNYMRKESDGGVVMLDNSFLNFAYPERYSAAAGATLEYKIYKSDGAAASYDPLTLAVKEGENFYSVSVCADGWELDEGYYILQVQSISGDHYFLHFQFDETICND